MSETNWNPTKIIRYVKTVDSSSRTAIVHTDAGRAYLKATNNPEGRHILACDWLGTKLAHEFGLQTFDAAILNITEEDQIPIQGTILAEVGAAFVTRSEVGIPMGQLRALTGVANTEDVARLVVFDTWVRNCDRYAPGLRQGKPRSNADNVFLSMETGTLVLKAIDHGHILTCGKPLSSRLAHIEFVQESKLYGLFPFFLGSVTAEDIDREAKRLKDIRPQFWQTILRHLPVEWDVSDTTKQAIDQFLSDRAQFLIKRIGEIAAQELSSTLQEGETI
ncbi:MAG: hypothetical protein HY774_19075 [Acidobacteria bacterium]|nr:hypothetical protein [Acidobacteriota bacterium]